MREMFWSCSQLKHNYLPDITKWDTKNAIDAQDVFDGYEQGKNKHIGDYIVSGITKIPRVLNIKNIPNVLNFSMK